ncbi:MAG: AAA family ATPase, partial [Clostridia bacterium]|nr:AAA family ATPase [Clostridia bacterium]
AESEKINNRLGQISKNGDESVIKLSELKQQEQKLVETLEQLKAKLSTSLQEKEVAQDAVSNNRYRLGLLKTNVVQSQNDIDTYKADILKTEDALDVKQRYVGQLKEALQILIEGLDNTGEYEELSTQLEEVKAQLSVATQTKATLNAEFQQAGDERMQLSSELEGLRSAIDMEEYKIQKIDDDLQELQQRVLDEYNVTYSAAMVYKDEEYEITASKAQIAELRQSMQNLGYVNVNAIEELRNVEERYGSIQEQMQDLTKAESDLKDILKQLTVEIEGRFATGIVEINENFKTVFRELFNGGNAKLTLDNDPEKDPLDCGVEIEAQPPGKRLQNISLLSGGERTLTAAAILFAILKLHPMPFCVLDEIEAALDDANADRIAKYLRKFSNDTQFIVITHKKPTMENADVLYGVTMEEKGVSKMVSVKLNDAIKQAQ